MAITGNGTATSPYVVHDYWELKKVCCSSKYEGKTYYTRYVRLGNDINCNDRAYGDDFEWETINLGRGSDDASVVDLDLDGKSIKNIMIKRSNSLFCGISYSDSRSKIHDGKILNIFSNSAAHIIDTNASGYVESTTCDLENLSWSINGATLTGYAFDRCNFNKCSLYFESNNLVKSVIHNYSSEEILHVNSDFKFDIKVTNNQSLFYNSYGKTSSEIDIYSCRISGNLYDNDVQFSYLGNCVFDLECKKEGTWNRYATLFSYSSGIFNTDKAVINEYVNLSNMIKVNSTDIKNADTLTGKGFTVVDIKQSASN